MAARKGRAPVAASITQQSLEQASTALSQLPEKPKTHWSLREAIKQLQGTISSALSRGYSHQEVAAMLGEQGIRISPASLKSYLAASSREAGIAPRRQRVAAKTAKTEAVTTATIPVPESTPEEAPAPKKTRSPRTASKAPAKAKTTTSPKAKTATPAKSKTADSAKAKTTTSTKAKKTTTEAKTSRPGRRKASTAAS
ncbi:MULTISPECIES: hypothetical protein [unclassified Leptolyngbya]|uniref:hypothetical protein n=1 Tax=unclassified Leptolyngbya TaxID=2650499 RepID=UPI001684F2C8|nr:MULTISPECIES: hypothetical protein [unclassified Leptolyngbya]MBD1909867.1 hypothetical protein [Leptolyngbya sp. FACHB-8]MBD2156963.1 hypothetical protein [Leptolyngbya sp. FACHB-16]